MNAKKLTTGLLALLIALSMVFAVGCGAKPNTDNPSIPPQNTGDTPGGTEPGSSDGPDYESMSLDELYELTLAESGTITIYSTTTNAYQNVKRIEQAYPELKGKFSYIECDTVNVADRITMENESGNINADVLQVKDNSGEIYYELVGYEYLEIYRPESVVSKIDPELTKYGMPTYASFSPWYYNTEMYPDGCPLVSWWDIVEGYNADTASFKDASGKDTQFWTVFTKDITSASYAALWTQIIVDGDAMAAQYEAQYGKPLEYTYHEFLQNSPGIMEFPENNGGVELFWRFSQMKSTELDDGDQVVMAVDQSLAGPTLGLASAGKRDNINSGAKIEWVTGLQPYTAFYGCDYIYPVNGCDNPAGARFFILFSLGGEDGKSGALDHLNARGTYWSTRSDYQFDATPFTAEEVNLKSPDFNEIYAFYPNVKSYWLYWRSLAPN
ncbi:hypothetical protein LJC07_04105 [Christensenellaceae bacterium OttesenSCG-928-L17]|nr:hypothetical protein [Christensenellaceae bacterium OttesenSCG-928-L17]